MGKSGMNEIEEDTAKETGMQEQGRKNKHKRNEDKGDIKNKITIQEYLKIKKHSPIQVNALSKFSYFVVCDAYSETLACLLKCNCQQLYFHVGMGM